MFGGLIKANKAMAKVTEEAVEIVAKSTGKAGTAIKNVSSVNPRISENAERVIQAKLDKAIADRGQQMFYKVPTTVTANNITQEGYRVGFLNNANKTNPTIDEFLVDSFRMFQI